MTWLKLKDAPIETLGYVWSPDKNWENRTDLTGTVHQYVSGQRVATGHFHGFNITHWHPLLDPPKDEK